jgi:hypothetical protein
MGTLGLALARPLAVDAVGGGLLISSSRYTTNCIGLASSPRSSEEIIGSAGSVR